MSGKVGGAGIFGSGPDGFPQIVLPNVQGLAALRSLLIEKLAEEGIQSPSEHDWVPHMTLAYVDAPKLPDLGVIGLGLTFNQISLVVNDERKDFPLDPEGASDDVHRARIEEDEILATAIRAKAIANELARPAVFYMPEKALKNIKILPPKARFSRAEIRRRAVLISQAKELTS
jgi:hypothetical protein